MQLHRWIVLGALTVALVVIAGYALAFSGPATVPADPNPEGFKQIAAPPSDFVSGKLRLPDPAQWGERSSSSLLPVKLMPAGKAGSIWAADVPVDSAAELQWTVLAPPGSDWALRLTPPAGGEPFVLARDTIAPGVQRQESSLGMGQTRFPATAYRFDAIQPAGAWRVEISSEQAVANPGATVGFVAVSSASPYRLYSYVNRLGLVAAQGSDLISYVFDQRSAGDAAGKGPAALPLTGLRGTIHVQAADASPGKAVALYTAALAADPSGRLRVALPALSTGNYIVQVVVYGATPEGKPFVRTNQLLVAVVQPSVTLAGQAQAAPMDADRLRIDLRVDGDAASAPAVRAAAEVWGRAADGSPAPVAWISSLAKPVAETGGARVSLVLDGRWIALAKAQGPFELRNVRLQDRDHNVLLSSASQMPLAVSALPASASDAIAAVTPEMLMGARPAWLPSKVERQEQGRTVNGNNHALMLVHGYCSSDVWATGLNNGNFTNAQKFLDLDQNRTHDQFAILVRNFGLSQLKSYGIVAHSQGGAASLHLYATYWSGLDWVDFDVVDGTRLIQSLGTPYQGTALAGNLAWIGNIFGTGCGSNTDLTYEGAAAWLANIPSWARSKVYYTTTGENSIWAWNSCTGADFLLDDPNDGVTENSYAQLSGANNMGYTDQECHVTGGPYPAQYYNATRNSAMNAAAKR